MTTHLNPHRDSLLLSQYIEGDLEESQAAELEAHLRECDECRSEISGLRQTVDILSQLQAIQAPADFLPKVHSRLRRHRQKRLMEENESNYGQRLTTGLIFVAVIVLIFVVVVLLKGV